MQVRYRYRIYPGPRQQQMLARTFGCARVVYNDCIRVRDEAYAAGHKISDAEIQRRVITLAKQTPERAWLGEVASVVLVQACQDARRAYRNWFDSLSGRRKGPLPSVPSSVTVIREADGRYYASFVVERQATPLPVCDREIGVDLGLASLAVTSDGEVIENPRFLRARERKLARAQRALSRKKKGSANRDKARRRVAVLHRKVRETRLDHAHKTALKLVRENQAVYAEDLSVSGLSRTRLARSVHDAGWSQLARLIEEKAAQYGRTFGKVGRFEPTSQVCSACGVKDGPKPLSVRTWTCSACGAVHDRDVNAARNVLKLGKVAAGRAETVNARGGQVRPGAIPAPASEAGTHRSAA